jgi:hypothetical protein
MGATASELARIRATPDHSALLFLTDRCPVECAHCSVASLRGGPGIADWPLFEALVGGLAARDSLRMVAISGGEPFAERRGLQYAVGALAAAGKRLVLYTSGFLGGSTAAGWAAAVMARAETVVLSTDAHHRARLPDEDWLGAARAARGSGAWLVVQTLAGRDEDERARALLRRAFGPGWADWAEVDQHPGLAHGRGASWYRPAAAPPTARCGLVGTPVVRYDGRVTACCNETVIMGGGPARLRRTADSAAGLEAALDGLAADPLLWAVGAAGPATLLAEPSPDGICAQCWRLLDRFPDPEFHPFVEALRTLRTPTPDPDRPA